MRLTRPTRGSAVLAVFVVAGLLVLAILWVIAASIL
ncbi:exported hypothetical protein [metagenome]|uniref:Uncharacterized protein n=1 Tax=metagenome TaxID=256318 RepID=A0A2P2C7J8_9ZZZZ